MVTLGVVSLEPWDDVWRRNQHLAHQLVAQGLVNSLVFVEPPSPGPWRERQVASGIVAVTPRQRVPKRAGGLRLTALRLRRGALAGVDRLWLNAPDLGVNLLGHAPAAYDVTDDWRQFEASERVRARVVAAEDALAAGATTIVCSEVLQERWYERYGVQAAIVHNGVDLEAVRVAEPMDLPGPGPHVGYVGTLHSQRLNLDLVHRLAAMPEVGTLHLVGPDALTQSEARALAGAQKVLIHGPVPASEVPRWTSSLDVLLCPHVVSPFTLSLDAIKAYEYLASCRPIVATPTSGFQHLGAPVTLAADSAAFLAAVRDHLRDGRSPDTEVDCSPFSWSSRARAFAAALGL